MTMNLTLTPGAMHRAPAWFDAVGALFIAPACVVPAALWGKVSPGGAP